MASIKRFEEIKAWELARKQCLNIWNLSNMGTFLNDHGLKNQINRASGSVMDNIAEGFGRGGNREFINFLGIARASNDEVRSQIYRALDRGHISETEFMELVSQCTAIGIRINNFIEYLRKSDYKGQKFKK